MGDDFTEAGLMTGHVSTNPFDLRSGEQSSPSPRRAQTARGTEPT